MFIAYLRGLFCLFGAVRSAKRSLRVVSGKPVRKFQPFPFSLQEMRCPICGRRPHKGLTAELSARARSEGMVGCEIHGPVQAIIVASIGSGSVDADAA
jgi:hypothetical protein